MSDSFPTTPSSPRRRRQDKHGSVWKNEILVRRYHKRSLAAERTLKRLQKQPYFLLFGDAVDVIPFLAPPSAVTTAITKGIKYTPDLLVGDWVEVDNGEYEDESSSATSPTSLWDFLRPWRS